MFRLASEAIKVQEVDTVKICCIAMDPSDLSHVFSYFRLFTLSAHSDSHFWGRTLLAYLLRYSGHISPEFRR